MLALAVVGCGCWACVCLIAGARIDVWRRFSSKLGIWEFHRRIGDGASSAAATRTHRSVPCPGMPREDPYAAVIPVCLKVCAAGLCASKDKATAAGPGTPGQSGEFEEVFLYAWPKVRNWTPHQSGIKFTITNAGVYEFRTKESEAIVAAIMRQINSCLLSIGTSEARAGH